MKALKSTISRALPVGTNVVVADNSGARIAQIIGIKGQKSRHGRRTSAGIGDLVKIAIKKGKQEVKHEKFEAVVVRQKKEFKRANGTRIKFEDNAVVIIKDELGNPKGTQIKGPIAKEVVGRWPSVAKIASIIL